MDSTTDDVRIHYRRPPDREDIFVQRLLARESDCIITLMEHTPMARGMHVDGAIALEDGSPVIWFTFPGRWHDIGLFHTAAGAFTGTYANILTPVRFLDDHAWQTTDLFLDIWMNPAGQPTLLDEDEFEQAVRADIVDRVTGAKARAEAERILRSIDEREWPPEPVGRWSLERALAALGADGAAPGPSRRGTSEPAERA